MRTTTQLRRLVTRPDIAFMMEAHDGLSARIVEEAGFEGIWASGLTLSASFGVRDNNELSWTQVVDHVAFMAEAASVPVLLDGDTGYGNFNNMRRLVRKLTQVGVAGVVIEDKLFPKTNSFLRSELQPLADIAEFCGKIKAGKDSQQDPDFVLVARVEALIAGWGLPEALKRAEAYHAAGADAILIHSKQSSPAEIFAFLAEWGNRSPVVLVPTTYWRTSTEDFRARHGQHGDLGKSPAEVVDQRDAGDGAPPSRGRFAAGRRAAGRAAPRGLSPARRCGAGRGRAALSARA